MPPQSPADTKKLVVFVAMVVGSLAIILGANVAVRSRTSAFSEGAGTPRRAGLERLWANPTKCAMTMKPSPDNERPMRHVNAGIIGDVDVLVLGQSDADHMSHTFFKDGVRFYNDFISNSYFVLEYEAYLDVVTAHGPPKLVLYDVRSGFLLQTAGVEPGWDTPANSSLWWGFSPFHLGKAEQPPWYKDIPSLLSLAQTDLTLTWLEHQLPTRAAAPDTGETQEDNGQEFRCVDVTKKSGMYRWLADGSRVYADEVGGVLSAPSAIHVTESIGDRHVNETRLPQLDWVFKKILAAGSKLIVYSPPIHPASYLEKRQAAAVRAAGAAYRKVTDANGLDYCDLAFDADSLGCGKGDFADELHISRECDRRILKRLVSGCAPKVGPMLKEMMAPAALQ